MEAPDARVRTSTSGEYPQRLIELDGNRDGPVDHGPVDNFLKVRWPGVFVMSTCWLTVSSVLACVLTVVRPQLIGGCKSCEGGLHWSFEELGIHLDVLGSRGLSRKAIDLSCSLLFLPPGPYETCLYYLWLT